MPGLFDRSRRPLASPFRTPAAMEARVLGLRTEHPVWGGRKIARRLRDLGMEGVPSASTITEILRRHGRLDEARAAAHRPFLRFEHAEPNALWQMDFKGHFATQDVRLPSAHRDRRPQPLCSRARRLRRGDGRHGARPPHRAVPPLRPARDDARRQRPALGQRRPPGALYRARGLAVAPRRGPPARQAAPPPDPGQGRTLPPHLERRTPARTPLPRSRRLPERLRTPGGGSTTKSVPTSPSAWTPRRAATRASPRTFPETLPEPQYHEHDTVRRVGRDGYFVWKGRKFKMSQAFRGLDVALRPTTTDGLYKPLLHDQGLSQTSI